VAAQPVVANGSIDNYPLTSYYDGTSAEVIHERAYLGFGAYYYLKQWQASGAGVSGAEAARAGLAMDYYGNQPHALFNMTSNGMWSDNLLADTNAGFETSGSWHARWDDCS
jgi:hypothetical protein